MTKPEHSRYFAKYLPVEGEIKRGDKAFDEHGVLQHLSVSFPADSSELSTLVHRVTIFLAAVILPFR